MKRRNIGWKKLILVMLLAVVLVSQSSALSSIGDIYAEQAGDSAASAVENEQAEPAVEGDAGDQAAAGDAASEQADAIAEATNNTEQVDAAASSAAGGTEQADAAASDAAGAGSTEQATATDASVATGGAAAPVGGEVTLSKVTATTEVLSNDKFKLFIDEATGNVRVVSKQTGTEWLGAPQVPSTLPPNNKKFVDSPLHLRYTEGSD